MRKQKKKTQNFRFEKFSMRRSFGRKGYRRQRHALHGYQRISRKHTAYVFDLLIVNYLFFFSGAKTVCLGRVIPPENLGFKNQRTSSSH